jgi:hypothetical protein
MRLVPGGLGIGLVVSCAEGGGVTRADAPPVIDTLTYEMVP